MRLAHTCITSALAILNKILFFTFSLHTVQHTSKHRPFNSSHPSHVVHSLLLIIQYVQKDTLSLVSCLPIFTTLTDLPATLNLKHPRHTKNQFHDREYGIFEFAYDSSSGQGFHCTFITLIPNVTQRPIIDRIIKSPDQGNEWHK